MPSAAHVSMTTTLFSGTSKAFTWWKLKKGFVSTDCLAVPAGALTSTPLSKPSLYNTPKGESLGTERPQANGRDCMSFFFNRRHGDGTCSCLARAGNQMHDCRLPRYEFKTLGQAGLPQHVPAHASALLSHKSGPHGRQNETHVLQNTRMCTAEPDTGKAGPKRRNKRAPPAHAHEFSQLPLCKVTLDTSLTLND